MALPIAATPILTGKDAVRFMEEMNRIRTPAEKEIDRQAYLRAKKVWDDCNAMWGKDYFLSENFTKEQVALIQEEAKEKGLTVTEILKGIIDDHFKEA